MADSWGVTPRTMWRLVIAPIVCGLVACSGSTSPPAPTPPPPVPTLVSISLEVRDSLPEPLEDVRVEITSGEDAGKFAMSSANGRVTIEGLSLSGLLSVQISKPGFSSANLTLASADTLKLVTLIPDVLLDLTGEHQLTVEADAECQLPELARMRTYQASFMPGTNTPWYFNIHMSGASFFSNLDHFATYVNADALRYEIYLPGFEEEDPMVEQLSPTEYLTFAGEAYADANQADTVIAARFRGSIGYCEAPPNTTYDECAALQTCWSESHKLILTRQ